MKKLFGFTLSEVLIAMAILGIVSALTIPHIAGNTTKKQYTTAFKTTINNLQSGIQVFKADNGYDFSGNRTQTDGQTIFRKVLEEKMGAQLTRLKTNQQWVVQGIVANTFGTVKKYTDPDTQEEIDIKTKIFFSDSALDGWKITTPTNVQTLAFGTSNDSGYEAPQTADKNPSSTTTLKLKNGAYILLLPNNESGCNLNNVRWTGSEYETPNINANSHSDSKINLCLAYIDVNGPKGPNRITNCITNSTITSPISTESCENMTAKEVADVFPIFYYDDQIFPATTAGYTVLNDLLVE